MKDKSDLYVTVKTRLEKFEGDDRTKPPVEVIVREDKIPLSELPPGLRKQVEEQLSQAKGR